MNALNGWDAREYTPAAGTPVHAAVLGRPESPIVVCVHGLGCSHAYFLPIARKLADEARVVAPDPPASGVPSDLIPQAPTPAAIRALNAEYVVIRNGDDVSHSVSGWTVRDAAGHVYKFGTFRLGAGKQAIIHTGKGTSYTTSASTHLYQGRGWYVWNNTGDKVILRRADGSLKDTCSYPGEGASKYYC